MYSQKKLSKEDTWRTEDLKKHLHVDGSDEGRRRERSRRDRESAERPAHKERDHTRERTKHQDAGLGKQVGRFTGEERERSWEVEGMRAKRLADVGIVEKGRRQERREGETDREHRKEREREKRHEGDREGKRRHVGMDNRDGDKHRDREKERERHREREVDRDRDGEKERRHRDREKKERHRVREADRDKDGNQKEEEKHRERVGNGDKARDKEGERHREREMYGHRERQRDKEVDRDKETERQREKDAVRHKDRERQRERGADRDRHGEQDKHREGGEEMDQERERQKRKERERERRRVERESQRREAQDGRQDATEQERERSKDKHRRDGREGHHHNSDAEADRRRTKRREASGCEEDREKREPQREGKAERERQREGPESEEGYRRKEHKELEQDRVERKTPNVAMKQRVKSRELMETEPVAREGAEFSPLISEDVQEDAAAEEYEDDFEDYEEDFDDLDENEEVEENDSVTEGLSAGYNEEIAAIQRAMDEENERVGSLCTQTREQEQELVEKDSRVSVTRGAQQGKFIDFVAAKQREVSKIASNKQKKRSAELLRLVDLDFSITFSLLDLPPVNEYDMYIKSFGNTNTQQAYVQCNEDNTEREIQTDEVELIDKWTQHPGDRGLVCGGPTLINEDSDSQIGNGSDSQHLAAFLRSASQVVCVLLEEERADKHSLTQHQSHTGRISFAEGSLELSPKVPFLHGREVSLLVLSQSQRHTLLSVHPAAPRPSSEALDSHTVLCVWNIWEPSRPQKVLLCESEVCCCGFSPGKAWLVFSGSSVGSVSVWDLREHPSLHYSVSVGESQWSLRYPTFSTDAIMATAPHLYPLISVEPVAESLGAGSSLLPSGEESAGMSFQLASLDEMGVMNLWVVVELPKADPAGSQTDLGLKPGGKVKLLHSSCFETLERRSARDALKSAEMRAVMLKFLPSDSSHFFIGTDTGLVIHGTRSGLKMSPRSYSSPSARLKPVPVTSLDFHPYGEPLFLVGCKDGSMRLHCVLSEHPMVEWSSTCGGPVISAQWTLTRPAVFCVLTGASTIYMWDLLKNHFGPVLVEKIQSDSVRAMAVFGDPSKQYSGILLVKHSGKIEVQYLKKEWTVSNAGELDNLQHLGLDV